MLSFMELVALIVAVAALAVAFWALALARVAVDRQKEQR